MIMPSLYIGTTNTSPLSFIFENTAYHGMEGRQKKVLPQDDEEMLNFPPWICNIICPNNCSKGNVVLCECTVYRKPGKFDSKNIFIVGGSYEN